MPKTKELLRQLERRIEELERRTDTPDVRPSKVGGGGGGGFQILEADTEAELLAETPGGPAIGFVAAEEGKRVGRFWFYRGAVGGWIETAIVTLRDGGGALEDFRLVAFTDTNSEDVTAVTHFGTGV